MGIDVYPPLASLPRQRRVRRDDARHATAGAWCGATTSTCRSRRLAQPRRPAGRGHPRRGDRASATSCSAGPAGLRPLDGDRARDLEPDVNFQNAGLVIYHGRRELDQERHGVGRRAHVRGVQGAQQHPVRPRLGDRRRRRSRARSTCASRATARPCAPSGRPTARPGSNTGNATNLSGLTNPKIGMYATASTAGGTASQHGAVRLLHARRAAGPERRVRGHVAEPLPLEPDRPARARRLHRRRRQAHAAGGARRLLRQRRQRQPEHHPPARAERPWTDDHADDVQPERELRAGRPAGLRRRRQLREGRPRARRRPRLEFLREANNVAAGFGGFVNLWRRIPTTVELRIVSDGTTLRAYYRPVRRSWTPSASPRRWRRAEPEDRPLRQRLQRDVMSRDNAVFDFFRLTAGLPDTTAPTTTHTLAPAAPGGSRLVPAERDGDALHRRRAPRPQYKLGAGAFQAYSGAGHLERRGHHGRSPTARADAEGNVEADKTVTVKIDKTAPTSTATPGRRHLTGDGRGRRDGRRRRLGRRGLEYRLDGSAWTTYAAPVTISGTGAHTLEHRATDVAGNVAPVGTEDVHDQRRRRGCADRRGLRRPGLRLGAAARDLRPRARPRRRRAALPLDARRRHGARRRRSTARSRRRAPTRRP